MEVLKKSSPFKIDRTTISGSYGKSICLEGFDVDVVAFVNNENPPFDKVIENSEGILRPYSVVISNLSHTPHSIQFRVNGIDFDLLPAPNHTLGRQFYSPEGRVDFQKQAVHKKIQEYYESTGRYSSMFSSGLAESQVEFMKKQTAFTHEVVRLAKYWLKSIPIQKFPGSSMIIELIATFAAQRNPYYIMDGFRSFLVMMSDLRHVNITFGNTFIPASLSGQRPMILDPSNPYNNLGTKFIENPHLIQNFKNYAEVTLIRLTSCSTTNQLFQNQ